jgi:hypothetical protein
MDKCDELYQKWNLSKYYGKKSVTGLNLAAFVLEGNAVEENLDLIGKALKELPPKPILRLLPEKTIDYLLQSNFMITYKNGNGNDGYDARNNFSTVKRIDNMIHEIGHALWYNLIPANEETQKHATINAIAEDHRSLNPLNDSLIPTLHQEYAKLVGAYSGQFLLEDYPNQRMNNLEEHFARNFDYLIKGKPLSALLNSVNTINQFLDFYQDLGLIDEKFKQFYHQSIQQFYGDEGILKTSIEDMVDGDSITADLINRINNIKIL